MNGELRIAVVITAYNEAATICGIAMGALQYTPHVIIVDDGSLDGTAAALADLPITLLTNDANLGKAASLWRGMQSALDAGADAVVTLDGDGQHSPHDIARLVAEFKRNPSDIIIGSRLHQRENIPAARYYANRFASFWVSWAAGCPIADSQCGFRVYPGKLLREVKVAHDQAASFVFESEILIEAGRMGVKIVAVPIAAVYPRNARPSHFRAARDIPRIVRMVAWKLLSRGLFLPGLISSLKRGTSH